MELRDTTRSSIDPRRLVREVGKDALSNVLASTGYIPQPHTLSDVALALRQFHPILFGGPRGSGKTSLGEGLAQSCNLTMFYVAGVEGLTAREILGGWRRQAQERAIQHLVRSGSSLDDVIPVKVDPTVEHADMLDSRLAFIRTRIIADDAEDIESDT